MCAFQAGGQRVKDEEEDGDGDDGQFRVEGEGGV